MNFRLAQPAALVDINRVAELAFLEEDAGGGLRILLNKTSRANIRIDYAVALRNNSDGPGKRQSGFYFFLGEAF